MVRATTGRARGRAARPGASPARAAWSADRATRPLRQDGTRTARSLVDRRRAAGRAAAAAAARDGDRVLPGRRGSCCIDADRGARPATERPLCRHDRARRLRPRLRHVVERRPTPTTEGRLWHVRAGRIVHRDRRHERPIVFADDDRPGHHARRRPPRPTSSGTASGRARGPSIFTNNDTTDAVAADLRAAGVEIVADRRRPARRVGRRHRRRRRRPPGLGRRSRAAGRRRPRDRRGRPAARVGRLEPERQPVEPGPRHAPLRRADRRVRPGHGPVRTAGSRPSGPPPATSRASADDRAALGRAAAPDPRRAGRLGDPLRRPPARRDRRATCGARSAPGSTSIEHVKRYTTIGTAADQGKTSGVVASRDRGGDPRPGGRCRRRADVPAAVRAGQLRAARRPRPRRRCSTPIRTTPIQPWHVAARRGLRGRRPVEAAALLPARRRVDGRRPSCASARAARTGVAVMDATTLGKIDLQGPDAGVFLDRIYTNTFSTLKVGSCRYGVMCRLDGMVFDDGVTRRLARRPVPHDDDDRQRRARSSTTSRSGSRPNGRSCASGPPASPSSGRRSRSSGRARARSSPRWRPGLDVVDRGVPVHDLARRGHRGHAGARVPDLVLRASWRTSSTSRRGTAWRCGRP